MKESQDAYATQEFLKKIELLEAIEGIRRGLEDVRQGRTRPAREFLAELQKKYENDLSDYILD